MSIIKKKKDMLIIYGSPHSKGSTSELLSVFIKDFEESGSWNIHTVDTYQLNPHPCTGCRLCAKKESCAFEDMDKLDKELRQSDLLVIASPIYNYSFPSPLKAVLDRWQRYFEAHFALGKKPAIKKHRRAVALLTMGSDEDFGVEVATYQLKRAFSVMNTELYGCAVWSATDRKNDKKAVADKAALRLSQAILEGKESPDDMERVI